ncbi:hypothetical protein CgunFtcFv8_002272 [Champsocephalus gunnari]|uniref:Uncharacterized protein n=1 Tax=Champsocephalus gunnari TaxID=52237 RepID=A0AAN8CME9_CHAGU|nr:hypothetical protein CgunFtcFv8_002272 [Champsocephalus gunnari]
MHLEPFCVRSVRVRAQSAGVIARPTQASGKQCGRIETAWCPESCRDFREKPPCDGRPVSFLSEEDQA